MAGVVSVEGKGATRSRQVGTRKTNASEPPMMGRKVSRRRRNRAGWLVRDGAQGVRAFCLGGVRPEGGVSLVRAAVWNVGTSIADAKGDGQAGGPRQARVPMRRRGAERFVVAMKPVKAGRAKGPRYPATSLGQPVMGGAQGRGKAV